MVGLIFWRYLHSSHDEFWHHVMVDPSADEQLALSVLVTLVRGFMPKWPKFEVSEVS